MSNKTNRRFDENNDKKINNIDANVSYLFHKGIRGRVPDHIINDLKQKVNDEEVLEKIQQVFYERLEYIKKRSSKFTKLVYNKYGQKNIPLHIVLEKAKHYKKKYNLSDIEFDEFKNKYQQILFSRKQQVDNFPVLANTAMGQLFGDVNSLNGLNHKDSEYSIIDEIIRLNAQTKSNHASVIIQSMQYEDVSPVVKSSRYDPLRNNVASSIYPLIAALFIPKITCLDEHFLYSNIANIVQTKYNKEQLTNFADIKLLWSIINDSNDIVCSMDTALSDLKVRANVQNSLWLNVFNMRSGKFFEAVGMDFINAVDKCKITLYDAPDLLYIGDEGVILKRLLAIFSYRPIIVSTMPIFGTYGTANPVNFPVIANRVVSTPLLTLRLPPQNLAPIEIQLDSAIKNSQYYLENGVFVPKTQDVIFTSGVVIFHVPRRTFEPSTMYKNLIGPVPTFTATPSHIFHYEIINEMPVSYNEIYKIGDNDLFLRSVIILETYEVNNKNIVLSTAAIIKETLNDGPLANGKYYKYSPKIDFNNITSSKTVLDPFDNNDGDNKTLEEVISTTGTIFIYSPKYNE